MCLYLTFALGVGIFFSKRASSSTKEYFLSGRTLPWWLVGTSMVATTFASDTPLAVTEIVRSHGLWRNWFWWSASITHLMCAFLFARLWRRAEIVTDNELIELRYSGKPAAFLRGFKAIGSAYTWCSNMPCCSYSSCVTFSTFSVGSLKNHRTPHVETTSKKHIVRNETFLTWGELYL